VHVDGDDWTYEKFDSHGNLVGQGRLTDRRGRSWGRQVTEPAADLERFLTSRGAALPVAPVVAVLHDRGERGSVRDCAVLLCVGADDLLDAVRAEGRPLDQATVDRVTHLVRRDHRFHDPARR
jgi:hypothetical protein